MDAEAQRNSLFHYKALFNLSLVLQSKNRGEGSWLSHGRRSPMHFLWAVHCPQTLLCWSFTSGERESSTGRTERELSAFLQGHVFLIALSSYSVLNVF